MTETETESLPPPVQCPSCGEMNPYERITLSTGRVVLAHPPVKLLEPPVGGEEDNMVACPSCQDKTREVAIDRMLRRRMKRANVPERIHMFSFKSLRQQRPDEGDEQFRSRIWSMNYAYGVMRYDLQQVRTCLAWVRYMKGQLDALEDKPNKGMGLYIHGPVGTGKSTLAAVLASELVKGGQHRPLSAEDYARGLADKWGDSYHNTRELVRHYETPGRPVAWTADKVYGVKWFNESELLRRERLSWKGDQTPLYKAMTFRGVVVLDDLDSEGSDGTSVKPFAATAIERMICLRYDRRLPTIIVSNTHPDQLVDRGYGDRVYSRISETLEPVFISAGGPDWWRR